MSNQTNDNKVHTPYSSLYQNDLGVEKEASYNDDPYIRKEKKLNHDDRNSSKEANRSFSNYIPPSSHFESNNRVEVKNAFLDKAKHDFNILPSEYRDKLKRVNTFFILTSCAYPLYFLFYIAKDYPDISAVSRKKLLISTAIYTATFFLISNYSHNQYEKAYDSLRQKYSPHEIQNMIYQYHEVNTNQLINALDQNRRI